MTSIKEHINKEASAILSIPLDGSIEQMIDLVVERVHKKGGKLIVCGVGKAGHIAHQFATTLCSTGTPAVFLHPLEAQHGDLGILQPHDLIFAVSNSGETREVVELVELADRLTPKIPVVVLTKNPASSLAQKAAVVIQTGKTEEICPLGLTPTVSTTVMKVITDLIVVSIMDKTGFTKEQYALRHHSGYLGKKAKQ